MRSLAFNNSAGGGDVVQSNVLGAGTAECSAHQPKHSLARTVEIGDSVFNFLYIETPFGSGSSDVEPEDKLRFGFTAPKAQSGNSGGEAPTHTN